jgi:hypothetical protein
VSASQLVKLRTAAIFSKRLPVYLAQGLIVNGVRLAVVNFIFNLVILSRLLLPFLREFVKHMNPNKIGHSGVHFISF